MKCFNYLSQPRLVKSKIVWMCECFFVLFYFGLQALFLNHIWYYLIITGFKLFYTHENQLFKLLSAVIVYLAIIVCFMQTAWLAVIFCCSVLSLVFLLLHVATHIFASPCPDLYFCHIVKCRIYFSVDICEQRHVPTIWVTSSDLGL